MHSIDAEDLTICYSGMGLPAAQLCLIAALTEVGSCHVPNLTFYIPNLTGASNVPKIEQCQKYGKKDAPVHKMLLAGNIGIIENLANLKQFAGSRIFFVCLPLPLKGGSTGRLLEQSFLI